MGSNICKSRTYQLEIATNKWNKDDEINYSHALARRLPAEVLFDSIYKATGSISRLPGLPPGARAAQLVDSNVNLPGGFLELFNKPVRESSCECERGTGLNLGPILAMVNGPIVGDAIKDPQNAINRLVLAQKDDGKVVEEIYLAVLNRLPSAQERASGVKAIEAAGADHKAMMAEYQERLAAFQAYEKTLPAKRKAYEAALLHQKPTAWTTLELHSAQSKQGPPATAKTGATLTINKDGSVLASGKRASLDLYTVYGIADLGAPITALRLEVLSDPSLPAKGPGRGDNGNLVLTEFRVGAKPLDRPDAAYAPVKLTKPDATFQQDGFPIGNAIDGNRATGWALAPQLGRDHAAFFRFAKPVSGPAGVAFDVQLEQQYQGAPNHTIGKFRLSVTTDPSPKIGGSLTRDLIAILETPEAERTAAQTERIKQMYIAQDASYQQLAAEAAKVPPADSRVLGAQDLVWALINSPAFLFNH